MTQLRRRSVPVIDLFAGPGGLGEGFSSFRCSGAHAPFRIHLSIEKNSIAHCTLRLRSFYRQFSETAVPEQYYDVLRGKLSMNELYDAFSEEAFAADREAWNATLGDTPRAVINERISDALGDAEEWVLIGGPPCQAYSVAGRARNRGVKDYKPEADHRQYLYVEYLQVIADHWPAIFVMENVKGLLSANVNDEGLFQNVLMDLESPADALRREGRSIAKRRHHRYRIVPLGSQSLFNGVSVNDYVVAAEKYGIPQTRHRVILVGLRDDLGEIAMKELSEVDAVPSHRVLDDFPRLRSGISNGEDSATEWVNTLKSVVDKRWLAGAYRVAGSAVGDAIVDTVSKLTAPKRDRGAQFIEGDFESAYRPDWFCDRRLGGICQHQTRLHLKSDLHRYLFVASFGRVLDRSPRLREFPRDLLPNHKNVESAMGWGFFNDRFRVQVRSKPATTITSHIAKDGHYYIHYDPSQCRSFTLREAARIQTFPDNYFFCGPRTEGYGQVGNAVPPLLAARIAETIWCTLKQSGAAD